MKVLPLKNHEAPQCEVFSRLLLFRFIFKYSPQHHLPKHIDLSKEPVQCGERVTQSAKW